MIDILPLWFSQQSVLWFFPNFFSSQLACPQMSSPLHSSSESQSPSSTSQGSSIEQHPLTSKYVPFLQSPFAVFLDHRVIPKGNL